jgi:Kef-type K+ transport system membrane component KefB
MTEPQNMEPEDVFWAIIGFLFFFVGMPIFGGWLFFGTLFGQMPGTHDQQYACLMIGGLLVTFPLAVLTSQPKVSTQNEAQQSKD